MECEQLSLFDLIDKELCVDCEFLSKDYYRTEGKIFDFCTKKEMYIDRCLTEKEEQCRRSYENL